MDSMKLFIRSESSDSEALKCFIACAATGRDSISVVLEETASKKNGERLMYPKLSILPSNDTVYFANAICRYFLEGSSDTQKISFKLNDLVLDDWIQWEANALSLLLYEQSTMDKDAFTSSFQAILKERDDNATLKKPFLSGENVTLADIIVGVSLHTAFSRVSAESSCETMQKYKEYCAMLFSKPEFLKGTSLMAQYTQQYAAPTEKCSLSEEDMQGWSQQNVLYILESIFTKAIAKAFSHTNIKMPAVEVTKTKIAKFGDYQCNSAMSLFTLLKTTPHAMQSPRQVAEAIIQAVPATQSVIKMPMSVAGAGFINISLDPSFLASRIMSILHHGIKPSVPAYRPKVVIDFSSPNIAKDMHVGHLRSTIIGDAMCRILEFQGYEVARINHIGDWGTQFGMLICHLMDAYPNWESEQPNVTDLTQLYKLAKERFDQDENFRQRSKAQVVLLQSGDPHSRKVWSTLCEISRKEYQKVYDRLQVSLTEMGESFYNPHIPGVIEQLKARGITQDSDGALVVFTEQFKQPFMLLKSDGSYLYDTTDIAALWYRIHKMHAEWIIYYTDYTQGDHFKLLFRVAEKGGIYDSSKQRLDHIGFGTVNDESGKRFKTRSGQVVRLVDLLDEAKHRMKEQLLARIEAKQTTLPMDQVDSAAEKIGYGAVKYFDLRQSPTSNYVFSYDRMLSTNGDTAVYLLFAYARLSSIVQKSEIDLDSVLAPHRNTHTLLVTINHANEMALAIELLQFQDVLLFINRDLSTNRLCSYLYSVAEKVQTFVSSCRVLHSEEQQSRLLLCQATLHVMQTCFNLLGIDPLDQI